MTECDFNNGDIVLLKNGVSGKVKRRLAFDGYFEDGYDFKCKDVLTVCPQIKVGDIVKFKPFDVVCRYYDGIYSDAFGITKDYYPEEGIVKVSESCDMDSCFEIKGSNLTFLSSMVECTNHSHVIVINNVGYVSSKYKVDGRKAKAKRFSSRAKAELFAAMWFPNADYEVIE